MAAELAPEEKTKPVPQHDRKQEYQRIFNEAIAFENRLNVHVDPWLALCGSLVRSRLYFGLAAFAATSALAIALLTLSDASFWLALVIVAIPLLHAAWTSMILGLASTCGNGVQGSQGLAHTCSELNAVLDRERGRLEHARDVGEKGLTQYSNHSAVRALADLCNLRLTALLVHMRALRRINVLNETCDIMLGTSRLVALLCPLVMILLATAAFAFPFLHAPSIAPWATKELLVVVVPLAAIAFVTSLLPFFMVYGYVRTIQRRLRGVIESA